MCDPRRATIHSNEGVFGNEDYGAALRTPAGKHGRCVGSKGAPGGGHVRFTRQLREASQETKRYVWYEGPGLGERSG